MYKALKRSEILFLYLSCMCLNHCFIQFSSIIVDLCFSWRALFARCKNFKNIFIVKFKKTSILLSKALMFYDLLANTRPWVCAIKATALYSRKSWRRWRRGRIRSRGKWRRGRRRRNPKTRTRFQTKRMMAKIKRRPQWTLQWKTWDAV